MARTAAPFYEMVIPQGADHARTFRWLDAAGVPRDLTGFRVQAGAKVRKGDAEYLWYLDSEADYSVDGDIVLGGALGTITVRFPAESTALMTYEEGVWEMEATGPAGDVTRLVQGTTRLDAGVLA